MSAPSQTLSPLSFEYTPVEDLEQLRPRLTQLTHSLRKLEEALATIKYNTSITSQSRSNVGQITNGNFELIAIQNQFNVTLQQLASLSRTLQSHRGILEVTTVFPNREFNTMSGLLYSLLRKKLTPEVEEWIKDAQNEAMTTTSGISLVTPPNTAATATTVNTTAATTNSISSVNDILETALFEGDEITDNMIEFAHAALENYMFGGYLTKQEIDMGVKVTDILKGVQREDLESPLVSPSPPSELSATSTTALSENNLFGFIYQGLDSNTNL